MTKPAKPKRHRYVAVVVVETDEKVQKKALRNAIEQSRSRVEAGLDTDGFAYPPLIETLRVRSVDID